jgi:hypothetical protein
MTGMFGLITQKTIRDFWEMKLTISNFALIFKIRQLDVSLMISKLAVNHYKKTGIYNSFHFYFEQGDIT